MYTDQHEPDEECARSWIYRFRESDETGGICFLPSDQFGNSYRFPSSGRKQQDEGVKEIPTKLQEENVLYHQVVAVSLSTSLLEVDHDERPHSQNVADDLNQLRHRRLSCDDGMTKTGA